MTLLTSTIATVMNRENKRKTGKKKKKRIWSRRGKESRIDGATGGSEK